MVHLISILTHTKIEPCRRTEKLKPKVSSQAIKLTAPDAKRGEGESKVRKVHLDRQGQEVYKLAYSHPIWLLPSFCHILILYIRMGGLSKSV